MPTVFFQEPEETELEAAERKVAELEAELGPEHLDLVDSLKAVMMIHYGQARYGKAEDICRRALSIQEKSLGPEHPDVATALNNLAMLLQAQGSYAEARPLYERALAISRWQATLRHRRRSEPGNERAFKAPGSRRETECLLRRTLGRYRADFQGHCRDST